VRYLASDGVRPVPGALRQRKPGRGQRCIRQEAKPCQPPAGGACARRRWQTATNLDRSGGTCVLSIGCMQCHPLAAFSISWCSGSLGLLAVWFLYAQATWWVVARSGSRSRGKGTPRARRHGLVEICRNYPRFQWPLRPVSDHDGSTSEHT
jgi:hypothetical protein